MQSQNLSNSQSDAEVRLHEDVTKFCEHVGCPKPVALNHRGRPAKFCSPAHKVAAFRAKHRRADVGHEAPKRKLVKDHPAFEVVNTPVHFSRKVTKTFPYAHNEPGEVVSLPTLSVVHRIPKYGKTIDATLRKRGRA